MSGPADTGALVVIETPRTRVRHKRREDAFDDYRWRCDPDLQRYNAEPPYESPFETFRAQFEIDLAVGHERRALFSIESRDGRHVGNLMYYNADLASGSVEFGISIADEDFRGRGLGREIVAGFLRYVWRRLPYRTVVLHTLEWNTRAYRAFEAAGFEPMGRVARGANVFIRMRARREWWLLRDMEGDFAFAAEARGPSPSTGSSA